ncbi:MAG: hypothetical protein E7235_01735 [Lachnospiraceae bacterium]|nr:hypothetical protein [Lachnospiraceae bacterium]
MNGKYTVPELCKNAVIREGLLKELDDTAKRIFFISAGKGSGKTTLLCLYAKTKKNVFWYTADNDDNDIDSFIAGFVKPFSSSFDPVNENTDPSCIIDVLGERDLSVIIDNFEYIRNEEVLSFISDVVELSGKNIRFIFSSASILPVEFSKLYLSGELSILENDDMVFTAREAAEAFDIGSIEEYIESDGIPVVLNRDNAKSVKDYYEEVLSAFDDRLKDFVIKTSFLFRIYPEIVKHIVDEEDIGILMLRAKRIISITRMDDEGLFYTYGFRKYCEDNFAETGLRVRRSAYDFCIANGKNTEAVIYGAVTRDFDNIEPAVKNDLDGFIEMSGAGEVSAILSSIDDDKDMYCRMIKAVCLKKTGRYKEALSLIEELCQNIDSVDSRKDKAALMILKGDTHFILTEFDNSLSSYEEAKAILKNYDNYLNTKINSGIISSLLMLGSKEEAKQLCSELITEANVNGEYESLSIYKLLMVYSLLLEDKHETATADLSTINLGCIRRPKAVGDIIPEISMMLFMKNYIDMASRILNSREILASADDDTRFLYRCTESVELFKKHLCEVAEGATLDKEYLISLFDIEAGDIGNISRNIRIHMLVLKRVVVSLFNGDDPGVIKGISYLCEIKMGREGFILRQELSSAIFMLIVMKKEKLALSAVNELLSMYADWERLPSEILPLIVYLKSRQGEDISYYAEKYISLILKQVRVSAYAVGYVNRPVIDYIDSTKKYGDIIDELIKITGTVKKAGIKTFGGVDIVSAGQMGELIKWRTAKTKELFAYFVHHGGKPVAKADIVKDVFDIDDDKKATEIFNTTMYNLRKTVKKVFSDNIFSLSKGKYSMKLDGINTDIISFRASIDEFISEQSLSSALKIIELYKGEYLKGIDALWKGDCVQEYENYFCDAAEFYILSLKDEGKLDLAKESISIIWNEKCKSQRLKSFFTDYMKKTGIKTELK